MLVLVSCFCLGVIPWNPGTDSMRVSAVKWFRSVGMFGSEPVVISLRSDGEPALISFLQDCAKELPAASVEKVPVDRHAPSAERGIRTVRELANVQLVQLEKAGLSVCGPAMPYLLSHVATAHNRYSLEDGSGLYRSSNTWRR